MKKVFSFILCLLILSLSLVLPLSVSASNYLPVWDFAYLNDNTEYLGFSPIRGIESQDNIFFSYSDVEPYLFDRPSSSEFVYLFFIFADSDFWEVNVNTSITYTIEYNLSGFDVGTVSYTTSLGYIKFEPKLYNSDNYVLTFGYTSAEYVSVIPMPSQWTSSNDVYISNVRSTYASYTIYEQGYADGEMSRATESYWRGFRDGSRSTDNSIYKDGFDEGKRVGLSQGRAEGEEIGREETTNNFVLVRNTVLDVVSAPFRAIANALNFNLLGINLAGLFAFIITAFVIGFIIKRFI